MAVNPLIELRDVNKYFGELHVLRDTDLTVRKGEVVVVIGPSGSGRSPLCRVINRLEPVRSGGIGLDGQPPAEEGRALAKVRAEVGTAFRSFILFAHRTVLRNVSPAQVEVRGHKMGEADGRSLEPLDRVGLAPRARKYPARLSGGRQQRVAVARALATDPRVLLFDEPTSALDPEIVDEVLEVVRQLARDGMTTVVVTHEKGFARSAARRAVLMADGAVVEDRAPEEFFTAPRSDRAKDFLSKILTH